MSRWKPVREGLDPSVVRFVVELRRMKDVSGLNLAQLAIRTGRSQSSWERYLDGRSLAPYEAVESLTKLAAADQTAVMALFRTAKDAWRPMTKSDDVIGEPPVFIPRAVIRLADELKTLRDRTGLSLVAVASKTRHSKSSWSRWLSAKALPPWHAVQALCALVGEPEADLRALWNLAEQEWSRREVVAPARAPSEPSSAPLCAAGEEKPSVVLAASDSGRFLAGILAFAAGVVLGCAVMSPVVAHWLVR